MLIDRYKLVTNSLMDRRVGDNQSEKGTQVFHE